MSTSLQDAINWAREAGNAEAQAHIDEAAARETIEQAKKSIADAADAAAATAAAAGEAQARDAENAKRQSIFDSIYAIAAADGAVTAVEQAKMVLGLGAMLGQSYDESTIVNALATAKELYESGGIEAIASAAAEAVPEREGRSALLVLASAVAWLDHGVGTKEGLALQALARTFDIEINDLHRLMAVGKVV